MVKEIKEETIIKTLEDFKKFLDKKIAKKGRYSFNSIWEIFGKGSEEWHEVLLEVHKKDHKNLETELMDMAVVCLWGIASIRENNK